MRENSSTALAPLPRYQNGRKKKPALVDLEERLADSETERTEAINRLKRAEQRIRHLRELICRAKAAKRTGDLVPVPDGDPNSR